LDAELKLKKISVAAIEPRHVKTAMFDRLAGRMGTDPSLAVPPEKLAEEILAALG
jgi:short-subunit dehydrogenase